MNLFIKISFIVVFAIFVSTANAQVADGFQEAKLKKPPKVVIPKEAKETNLGGRVVVRVTVDENGNVVSVEDVSGPGAVCRSVERTDVVAIRNAAAAAAKQAKFYPAMANGSPLISETTVELEYPVKKVENKSSEHATFPVSEYSTGQDSNSGRNLSGGVLNHKAMALPKPTYPRAALAVKAAGSVQVRVLIDEDGTIFSADAESGHPLLRAAAVTAACGARFTPTKLSGQPVKVSGIITYNFVNP